MPKVTSTKSTEKEELSKSRPKKQEEQAARTSDAETLHRATNDVAALSPHDVLNLQQMGGNRAVGRMLATKNRLKKGQKEKIVTPDKKTKFDDFDGKQYRVAGEAPNRVVQEVKRSEEVDEKGDRRPVYYALGEVRGFQGKMPIMAYYPQPINLGNWYPSVTHLNGMNVAPQSGIADAVALQESVNQSLEEANAKQGVALSQDAVDVLYTYSAKRSNFFLDVLDCIKGKIGVEDTATERQEQLMLDAVRNKNRVTVSAHSRGTIKTDNAVRNAYEILSQEYVEKARRSQEVQEVYNQALFKAQVESDSSKKNYVSPEIIAEVVRDEKAKQVAKEMAKADMNAYIQLIYAGNAVTFPSSVLKADMYVGKKDMVSLFFGSYTGKWAKWASKNKKTDLHKVSGGHGFKQNYVKHVGDKIAEDVGKRHKRSGREREEE